MEQADQAFYKTLRDDTEATVGLRALLGSPSANPYNVYHAYLPEALDFSPAGGAQSFLTYLRVSSRGDIEHPRPVQTVQSLYDVTGYSRSRATLNSIMERVKLRLHRMRNVTAASSQVVIHQVLFESEGSDRFDEAFNCHWRVATYRMRFRDDNIG